MVKGLEMVNKYGWYLVRVGGKVELRQAESGAGFTDEDQIEEVLEDVTDRVLERTREVCGQIRRTAMDVFGGSDLDVQILEGIVGVLEANILEA